LGGQDVEDGDIERAKFKILYQCTDMVCDNDGIEMQSLDSSSFEIALTGTEECPLNTLVHDDSIFLQWVNPPHLKRLTPLHSHFEYGF
jgi:hypothetical protein